MALTMKEAKAVFLAEIAKGRTISQAADSAERTVKTIENWISNDDEFRDKRNRIRFKQKVAAGAAEPLKTNLPFAEFSQRYLHREVPPHIQNIIDVMEGREPSWMHPSFDYQPGSPNMVLVNVPPEHAKTTSITVNYVTHRIAEDHDFRGIVVSKARDTAKEYLYSITQNLSHPEYQDLIDAYGGVEGFQTKDAIWQSDKFYLGPSLRSPGEKDPTLVALGVGSQVYGKRAKLIVLDDIADTSNAHEWAKQMRWIRQDVLTRLGPGGILLVVGTRVDNLDIYSELTNDDHYSGGKHPFTVLRMPAVLELNEDPKDWVTLWPRAATPWDGVKDQEPDSDGLYPHWDGAHLFARRAVMDARTWALVYQQQEVPDDGAFHPQLVRASVNGMRRTGLLQGGVPGHPLNGMSGKLVVCSMDPAIAGDMAAIAYAVDRETNKRYILDALKITGPLPSEIRKTIKDWTEKYSPQEWRIEKNSFQAFLTQDEELRQYLASRGVMLREHVTGTNKWDVDYGVASMSGLFGDLKLDDRGIPRAVNQLVELPSSSGKESVKALIEQLITWRPGTKNKTDMVMALWFAEIRAREWLQEASSLEPFLENEFATEDRLEDRIVINVEDYLAARRSPVIGIA